MKNLAFWLVESFWTYIPRIRIFSDMELVQKVSQPFTLHFRPFLAKTNDSIFRKSPKTLFSPFFGPFCPKSREWEFSQIWNLCKMLANNNTLHFRSFLAKSNDSILRKSPKTLFLGIFSSFWALFPNFLENESFPEKSGSVTFHHLWTPNFMQKNRKN